VLTVRAHNANSHKDRGWEKFTDAVISHLNKNSHGIVFILWGSYAQKKGSQIDKVNCILSYTGDVFLYMLCSCVIYAAMLTCVTASLAKAR